MSEAKILVTDTEAARLLSIGRSTFWANVRKNLLPQPVKIGGATRWRAADIQIIVAEQESQRQAAEFEAKRLADEMESVEAARKLLPPTVALGPDVHHVYRHFDTEGRLLYLGISFSALHRLAQHRDRAEWFWRIARVEIAAYATREDAEAAERNLIRIEKPLHNVVYNAREEAV